MADEENWKVLGLVGVGEAGAVVLPVGADVPAVDEAGAREVRPVAHETVVEARPPGSGREFRTGGEWSCIHHPEADAVANFPAFSHRIDRLLEPDRRILRRPTLRCRRRHT